MVKKTHLVLGSVLASCLTVGLMSTAQAQNSFDAEIRQLLQDIKSDFNNYKGKVLDYYGISVNGYQEPTTAALSGFNSFETNGDLLSGIFANGTNQTVVRSFSSNGQAVGTQYAPGNNSSLTQEDLVSFMTVPFSAKDCADCSVTVESIRDKSLKDLTFPYTKVATSEILSKGSVGNGVRNPQNTAPLNANSLIGPLRYNPSNVSATPNDPTDILNVFEQGNQSGQVFGKNALDFIHHLTNLNRFRIFPKLPAPDALTDEGNKERTNYLSELYSFAANISVGLSNVYQMYAARVPTSNNGKSKMQVENDMVMRHMQKPWRDSIKNGSPAAVQKETAILLAEINYQLYQNRLIMERLLLTQSVMEIASSRGPGYRDPLG